MGARPLGKDCPGNIELSSDQEKKDHQAKEKDQTQPEASPNILIMPTQTLKPSKPYITKYFDNMSNDTPIIYTPNESKDTTL